IARFWVLWTHAFSACVMMASVVTRGGTSKTAQAALSELRMACDLFERAAKHGGRAGKFLPVVRKLLEKAQAAYFKGFQPLRRDIFSPQTDESEHFDELSIFSGRTARTVVTKSNRPQRISPTISSAATPPDASGQGSQSGSSGSDARGSQSPAGEAFPALESSYRAVIHPGLVDEMKTFDRQLEAQINQTDAYFTHPSAPYEQPAHSGQPMQSTTTYSDASPQSVPSPEQHYVQSTQGNPYHQHTPPTTHMQQQYPPQYNQHQQVRHHQQHPQPYQQHQQYDHQQQNHYSAYPPDPQSRRNSYHASMYNGSDAASQHHTPATPIDPHHIPMYGGFSRAPSDHQYNAYDHSGAAQPSVEPTTYPPHAVPVQRSELWSVNVQPAEPSVEPQQAHTYSAPVYPPQSSHLDEHISPHVSFNNHHSHTLQPQQPHPSSLAHAQTYAHVHPQQPPTQSAQAQQFAYTQGVQQMIPPPPPPLIHVHTGGYSLQETWTSFIQQELPGPPQKASAPMQSLPAK
ncbi:hypothetical protein GY45DRAFT_1339856, partial [Cubamyces sp. BRFM 1775]